VGTYFAGLRYGGLKEKSWKEKKNDGVRRTTSVWIGPLVTSENFGARSFIIRKRVSGRVEGGSRKKSRKVEGKRRAEN